MLKVLSMDQGYFLKSDITLTLSELFCLIERNSEMRKGSFAEKCTIKILEDLLKGAINLREKYNKYYSCEYSNFEEYLYRKELIDLAEINDIAIQESETLWELRFMIHNYSIKNIIGYNDENLELINQTLEYICNEN